MGSHEETRSRRRQTYKGVIGEKEMNERLTHRHVNVERMIEEAFSRDSNRKDGREDE